MKRFFGYKKWIAFLLVFLLAVSVNIASSDPFLWAAGEHEDEESGAPAAPATVEAVKEIKVPDNDKADRIQKPQDVYVYIAFTGVDTANVTEEYMREKYKYPKGTILEDGGKLWYTVGVIRGVPMYSEPEKPAGDSVCYASEEDKKAVLDRLGDIERFGDDVKNELPIPPSSDGGWTLKGASGAVDYDTDYNVEHPARWHLDGVIDLTGSADVVYLDENGDEIEEKGVIQTTAFKTTDSYTGSLEHAISGYSRQGVSVYRKYLFKEHRQIQTRRKMLRPW